MKWSAYSVLGGTWLRELSDAFAYVPPVDGNTFLGINHLHGDRVADAVSFSGDCVSNHPVLSVCIYTLQRLSVFPPYSWTLSTAYSQNRTRKSRLVDALLYLFRNIFGLFGRRMKQLCGLYLQFRSFFWVLHPVSNRDILTVDVL
jgi:hypothetical protein